MSAQLQSAPSREDFAALLEESFRESEIHEGSVVKGTVVEDGRRRHRIMGVGGEHDDGERWYLLVEEAVTWVEEHGHEFVVTGDEQASVEVRYTAGGRAYLRTVNDSTKSDNLSKLPRCPAPPE